MTEPDHTAAPVTTVLCLTCKKCESISTNVTDTPTHESLVAIKCSSDDDEIYPALLCDQYEERHVGDNEPFFFCILPDGSGFATDEIGEDDPAPEEPENCGEEAAVGEVVTDG